MSTGKILPRSQENLVANVHEVEGPVYVVEGTSYDKSEGNRSTPTLAAPPQHIDGVSSRFHSARSKDLISLVDAPSSP